MVDPDIWHGGAITNVSQYLTFFSSFEWGPKSIAKVDGHIFIQF